MEELLTERQIVLLEGAKRDLVNAHGKIKLDSAWKAAMKAVDNALEKVNLAHRIRKEKTARFDIRPSITLLTQTKQAIDDKSQKAAIRKIMEAFSEINQVLLNDPVAKNRPDQEEDWLSARLHEKWWPSKHRGEALMRLLDKVTGKEDKKKKRKKAA